MAHRCDPLALYYCSEKAQTNIKKVNAQKDMHFQFLLKSGRTGQHWPHAPHSSEGGSKEELLSWGRACVARPFQALVPSAPEAATQPLLLSLN